MAKRQKEWARQARVRLITKLGGKCAYCGQEHDLVFDCIIPQGDRHHRLDTSARMSFYHRQDREKNLQLLCDPCNNKKGNDNPDNPF